jgi:DNA-binding Lrp family transcriptional regulator
VVPSCTIIENIPRKLNLILYNASMSRDSSPGDGRGIVRVNPVHDQRQPVTLDETDRRILRELARDARMPNNTLAARAGIAPSTCLGRVRALRERGVIRGYHADVDQAALGRPLQAMIAVRLQAHARGHLRGFAGGMARLPEVLNIFFLAGKDDFLLHVAAGSAAALRDFVERLSSDADVAYTETSLIFEHIRADAAG